VQGIAADDDMNVSIWTALRTSYVTLFEHSVFSAATLTGLRRRKDLSAAWKGLKNAMEPTIEDDDELLSAQVVAFCLENMK